MANREKRPFFNFGKNDQKPAAEIVPSNDAKSLDKMIAEALPDLKIGEFTRKPLNRRRR
jgi:hypothetical protein